MKNEKLKFIFSVFIYTAMFTIIILFLFFYNFSNVPEFIYSNF